MRRSLGSRQRPLVSVLTPSIPERAGMLAECEQSVEAQTFRRWEHLVLVDDERKGCGWAMNRLAEQAQGEWIVPLADDDLLLPHCLDTLLVHSADADIVWSRPEVWGRETWRFHGQLPAVPSFALIRLEVWNELGGYDEARNREEDRDLWIRALAADTRFVLTGDEPTWVYRHHAGNKSFNHGVAA